jgi:hypothetical protein
MQRRLSALALIVLASNAVSSPLAQAQAPDFLPANQAVKAMMDGRPWNGLTSEGRRAKFTFNKDGTGTFEGPITMSISWEQKADAVCLNLRMAGTKCFRFRAIAGGFEGYIGNKLDATFTR